MNNSLIYIVDKIGEGKKLRFYLKECKDLSSRFIRHSAENHNIFVNDRVELLNYKLKLEDKVEIFLDKDEKQEIEANEMELDIIYEDQDFIIVNKPPNLVMHPTKSHLNGTLANGLIYHYRKKGENTIVRLVNRLDMDTSGLVISAKNQFTHSYFSNMMKTEDFIKKYIALCHGTFKDKTGIIDLPIFRENDDVIKRVVDERGKSSITKYEVIEEFKDASLLEVMLLTGRTHQIRVHLSHLGHPIYGDKLYGESDDLDIIKRQALHAYFLSFLHPKTGKIMEFKGQLPCDINEAMKKICFK